MCDKSTRSMYKLLERAASGDLQALSISHDGIDVEEKDNEGNIYGPIAPPKTEQMSLRGDVDKMLRDINMSKEDTEELRRKILAFIHSKPALKPVKTSS